MPRLIGGPGRGSARLGYFLTEAGAGSPVGRVPSERRVAEAEERFS